MQCVQMVYHFLDEIEQIVMQLLNRRHYDQLIPTMLYKLNSFGQRLISFNRRQLTLYNIPMRTKYFFNNPSLNDLSYASFAVLNETQVHIIGGMDAEGGAVGTDGGLAVPSYHQMLIIEVPIYQKQLKKLSLNTEDNQLNLKITQGPQTIHPRQRHACVSDGFRFLYLLGSQFARAAKEVERYDSL